VRDVVFLLLVLGFFAVAVLLVRGCALVLGAPATLEDDRPS
jgi:hypothetical protein